MDFTLSTVARQAVVCFVVAAGVLSAARADDRSSRVEAPLLPKYRLECAACHLAFPPRLLPQSSWLRVMNDLQRHYGTDASLDPAAAEELSAWLAANAGTDRRSSTPPPQDRITLSPWFTREHDEVPAATWSKPEVKSAANCGACHTQAEQGDFRERNVRVPR